MHTSVNPTDSNPHIADISTNADSVANTVNNHVHNSGINNQNNLANSSIASSNIINNTGSNVNSNFDPSTFNNYSNLVDLLTDKQQPWQVHNCKLLSSQCVQEGQLPFLYHYDRLADAVKAEFPLSAKLLTAFNTPMTASEANAFIGLDTGTVANPWFVKLKGSVVVYLEALQLAVKLNWSNSIQDAAALYCQTKDDALALAIAQWQFVGSVYLLRRSAQAADVIVVDEDNERMLPIAATEHYQALPSEFAVALLTTLNSKKNQLDFIDEAIKQRLA